MSASPYSGAQTRRNLLLFLAGKIPTAALTAAILGLSARALSASEFGRYVMVMAAVEFTLGMSTLGLDWILLRYLPAYRVQACRAGLLRLLLGVAGARALVLGALGLAVQAAPAGWLPLPADLVQPFAWLLLAEGCMRIFRDNALEALALQGRLQLIILGKNSILLAALLLMLDQGQGSAARLLQAELAAASLSLLLAAASVLAVVLRLTGGAAEWTRPTLAQMRRTALTNYVSGIAEYLYSPSCLILLLARVQPAATIAGLGFVLRLTDLIRSYLPGMLVFGVVRARMIGSYARDRDYGQLCQWAQFLYKISLLTLLPLAGVALVLGAPVLDQASGGRYGSYHAVFAALVCWLALRLHRNILNVVYNAIELMEGWARLSLLSLLVLPLLWWGGASRLGPWFLVAALYANELVMNGGALWLLRRRAYVWPLWRPWLLRVALALALACLATVWLPLSGWPALLGATVWLSLVYGGAALLLGVLDRDDRQLINRSAGRQLFRS